jgi:Domain of unknown function (DUF4476)
MKRISTLGFGILFSLASFAFAPNRLVVSAEGNANIKVTIDGGRFDQQFVENSVVFENLTPGFHAVKIYQANNSGGWLRHGYNGDYRLIYSASVCIKPLFETQVVLNRFGKALIDEQPIHNQYGNKDWGNNDRKKHDRDFDNDRNKHKDDYENDKRNDPGYGNNGYGSDNGNSYDQVMNNDDFFAIKRMLERESFDNTRLVIAKHIADVNVLTSVQVKEMAQLFSFDNSKLDFAKYAYNKTLDKNNYVVVCNSFSFSNSKEQLIDYIRSYR